MAVQERQKILKLRLHRMKKPKRKAGGSSGDEVMGCIYINSIMKPTILRTIPKRDSLVFGLKLR
jgi:hypothetical protein